MGNLTHVYDLQTDELIAKYFYDDQNRRIKQIVNGVETKFVYEGKTSLVVAELNGQDEVEKYYTWSAAGHLESIEIDEKLYYPVRNGQGNIVATYAYDAFGNIVEQTGQTDISPYRYAGYRYDDVTNLYYLITRYYQPEVGQFLSLDAMSELPDYTYAANNPLSYQDPDGNFILDIISIGIDLYTFVKEPTWSNAGWLASNAVSLFIPGNISLTAKLAKTAKNVAKNADASRNIGKVDKISSGSKNIQSRTKKTQNPSKSTNTNKGIGNSKVVYPSKPHTNKTAGHWETMVDKANELSKSDNISKVYLNKGISNEIPGVKPNRRPDIMAVRKDGRIDQYEVPSKTDDVNALINRMQATQRLLGDRAGNINILRIK